MLAASVDGETLSPSSPSVGNHLLAGAWLWLVPLGLPFLMWAARPRDPLLATALEALVSVWVLAFCFVAHELGHGWTAYQEGDRTAAELGRLSLDPRCHFDRFGALWAPLFSAALAAVFPSVVIAWAKPLPVNVGRLRNPTRGNYRVALGGPLMNLALLYSSAIFMVAVILMRGAQGVQSQVWPIDYMSLPIVSISEPFWWFLLTALRWSLFYNTLLLVLNLLPFPPFDGSAIFTGLSSRPWRSRWERWQKWGAGALLVLVVTGWGRLLFWPAFWVWYVAIYAVAALSGAPLPEMAF